MNGVSIRAARFRRPARIVAGLGLAAGLAFALITRHSPATTSRSTSCGRIRCRTAAWFPAITASNSGDRSRRNCAPTSRCCCRPACSRRKVTPRSRAEPLLGWRSRALLGGIALVSFLALMLLAYTGWNAVGSPRIGAFQGRYLLPLLPLVILCLPARQARAPATDRRSVGPLVMVAAAVLLIVVWLGLRSHFY